MGLDDTYIFLFISMVIKITFKCLQACSIKTNLLLIAIDDGGSLSKKNSRHTFLNTSSFHEELVTLHMINILLLE